jgi:cytidine diphosphoramidate kinase
VVIWIIGLSGSGKTTIANMLYKRLKGSHPNLVLLDGDILRDVWQDSLGHTIEARSINAARISNLCKLLDDQGVHVIAAVLSIFPDWQEWNRRNLSDYREIFLDVPLTEVQRRDPKGIYQRYASGNEKNVVGLDIPFPSPTTPDVVLSLEDFNDLDESIVEKILPAIKLD